MASFIQFNGENDDNPLELGAPHFRTNTCFGYYGGYEKKWNDVGNKSCSDKNEDSIKAKSDRIRIIWPWRK